MKKKRNKAAKRSKAAPQPTPVESQERRSFLSRSGKLVAALVIVGGGSAFAVSAVRATAREQDLSRVGQGVPTIVQIHDPSCSLCAALQKETRKALEGFDSADLDYVVANVKTDEGSAFAARHRQPHVTLMLMDPDGQPAQILNGPQDRGDLRQVFEAFAAKYR